jgi:hypothetical protein
MGSLEGEVQFSVYEIGCPENLRNVVQRQAVAS